MTWPPAPYAVGSLVRYLGTTYRVVGIASYHRMGEVQEGSWTRHAGSDYDQPFYLLRELTGTAGRDCTEFNQVCERIAGGRVDMSLFANSDDLTLVAGPEPNDNEVDA